MTEWPQKRTISSQITRLQIPREHHAKQMKKSGQGGRVRFGVEGLRWWRGGGLSKIRVRVRGGLGIWAYMGVSI